MGNCLATDNIVGLDGNKINFNVFVGKEIKLKKDGTPKTIVYNKKKGRSSWVDPIRSKEDQKKVLNFLESKVETAQRPDYKKAYARNLMYYAIAVFSGFRSCDLIGGIDYKTNEEYYGLKWQDIYCKDGKTFREKTGIIEKKTGKTKYLYLNERSKQYIQLYVDKFNIDTVSDNLVFTNYRGERLNYDTINKFIKEFAVACNLEGNYATHSLRKTFVYNLYMANVVKEGEYLALAKCQAFLNHANSSETLRYLGLKFELEKNDINTMEDYLSDVFD